MLLVLAGCLAPAPLHFDTTEPGWQVRQGQAVWRPQAQAVELAGDLVVAWHPDGRAFVQFAKPPVTLASAAQDQKTWQFTVPLQRRSGRGPNPPPPTVVWFQLVRLLRGEPASADWRGERFGHGHWRLENPRTGETLEGYLGS